FASANGHGTARALARIYYALCEDLNQGTGHFLSSALLAKAIEQQWDEVEKISNRHFRFGTGFMLNNPYFKIGKNPRSFGHPGLGGPTGFADPENNLGFGYCCNLIRATDNTGPCANRLIEALYQVV
ncbi:MAG: serine hydrolase, partial [Ketobacteraceae bacterium]|nr:serine hydrolase [Ketobacteraceae bacterium]